MAVQRENGRNKNLARWKYPYSPSPRQQVAHQTYADEMLYGGAAGGGKSEYLLASHVVLALMVPGSHSLILRRTFPDLQRSLIPRMLERIPLKVARYNVTDRTWYFKNGSSIELSGIERDVDVLRYQSAEYQLISFDELTQFTEYQYRYLVSRLRAAGDVRDRMAQLGWRPRIQGAANPGGPGHLWVKARFIDPAPPFQVWLPPLEPGQRKALSRVFVPARTQDNPHLDEDYPDRLASLDPILRRALLEGDWDILEGVRFTAFRRGVHVISPEEFPVPVGGITRAVGVDYGLDAPFSAHWGAKFADGLIVVYRELYAAGLTPRQQAEAIRAAEQPGEREGGSPVALDPSTWARNPDQAKKALSPTADADEPPPGSIAGTYRSVLGRHVVKAWNPRRDGAALLDEKLRVRPDGLPRILIYNTCTNLIRTLPALPRSIRDPEDVDTNAEDHAYDSLRYLLAELEGKKVGQERASQGSATLPGSGLTLGTGF